MALTLCAALLFASCVCFFFVGRNGEYCRRLSEFFGFLLAGAVLFLGNLVVQAHTLDQKTAAQIGVASIFLVILAMGAGSLWEISRDHDTRTCTCPNPG